MFGPMVIAVGACSDRPMHLPFDCGWHGQALEATIPGVNAMNLMNHAQRKSSIWSVGAPSLVAMDEHEQTRGFNN